MVYRNLPALTKLIVSTFLTMLLSVPLFAGEFLIKFHDQETMNFHFINNRLSSLNTKLSVNLLDTYGQGQLAKIAVADSDKALLAQTLRTISLDPSVAYIVPNIKFHALNEPNDPRFQEQWALAKVKATEAWNESTGSKNIVVAVIDTGADYNHPDLKDNIWVNTDEIAGNNIDDDSNGFVDDIHGWDFKDDDKEPLDETSDRNPGHGTHVSGIIGAVGNNSQGISGINHTASIMVIRFLGSDGSGDLMSAAKAIDYAINNGAQIISASWGAATQAFTAQPIIEAIGRANQKGVLFIAAAANDGTDNDTREVYPANTDSPNLIAVAASDPEDKKPTWSNFGVKKVHLSSPGLNILSTIPNNDYKAFSGTSMATPLVSGMVALLLSAYNGSQKLDGPRVKAILQSTGAKVDIQTACQCRIDAAAAMEKIVKQTLTVVPTAASIDLNTNLQFSAFGGEGPYKFSSKDPSIVEISETGQATAKAKGETTISVTDAKNNKVESLLIRAGQSSGGGAQCPLNEPTMCLILCLLDPNQPWCKDLPIPSP